jgi:hypothetical protein
VDELTYCPEEAWLRLEGRLRDPRAKRLCGYAAWTPKGFDWVYRRFIPDPVEGYEAIIAAPYENRYLLEKVPDFYKRLKKSYDEAFYDQEVLGQYVNLSGGLVYSAFRREEHLAEVELDGRLPLLWALDFNVDPMSSVVAQVDRETVRVLDEIVLRRATTQDACGEFLKRFPAHAAGVIVYGDASGHHMHTTGGTDYSMVEDFFAEYYRSPVTCRAPRSNPSVRERVMLTNSKLRNARGEAQMVVDPKCKELIKDFEQVSFKADSTEVDKDKDRQRTHLSDALGYLIWQECKPGPEIGERSTRLL